MDLDNQNPATTNANTDSAMPDFGGPISEAKLNSQPDIDMDTINQAVLAAGGTPSIQNTFDVNDISLDNVPTSQHELDQRMNEDPNLNLAGGSDTAQSVDFSGMVSDSALSGASPMEDPSMASLSVQASNSEGIALDNGVADDAGGSQASATPAAPKAEPAASFVAGDIIDEPAESDADKAAEAKAEAEKASMEASFGQINVDPINAEENEKSGAKVADQLGAPSAPSESAPQAGNAGATPAPASEPAHVANTITSPEQKKSKAPLFIGIGVGVAVIIIAVVVLLVVIK